MGSQFRASGLGWPALAPGPPLCGLLRANQERHALGNGDRKGVLGSFRDFMQGQVTCGINPNWGKAKGRGHICGDANGRVSLGFGEVENEPSQTPMWPQVSSKGGHTSKGGVRLLLPSQAAGQPGFGKGDGMPRRTRDEGPGKREQECLLGRGKLSSWGMTAAVAQQRLQGPAATPTPRNGIGGRDMPSPGPIAHGLAAGAHPEGKKGSFAKALEVARCKNRLGQALKDLNKGFWTSSTAAVKKSRREEVLKLAREVSGRREVLPLDRQTVEHVAAALKAGGLASADQYLNELKLLHVEAGYCLEAWLSRTFQLCKKSVARERGPVRRAPEVDLDELPAEGWDRLQDLAVPLGAWAYAWGVAWMLREIELSKVRWDRAAKTVRKNGPPLHPPLEDGPEGLGSGSYAPVLRRDPLLEGMRVEHPAETVGASWTSCRASRGDDVPQPGGQQAVQTRDGVLVENAGGREHSRSLCQAIGSHGLRQEGPGYKRIGLLGKMAIIGGSYIRRRGLGNYAGKHAGDPGGCRRHRRTRHAMPGHASQNHHDARGGSQTARRWTSCSTSGSHQTQSKDALGQVDRKGRCQSSPLHCQRGLESADEGLVDVLRMVIRQEISSHILRHRSSPERPEVQEVRGLERPARRCQWGVQSSTDDSC